MIAGTTCVMSLLCAVILGIMDKRAERILNKATAETGEVVRLRDVTSFPVSFWLLSVVCLAYYVAIFPFISLGTVFFEKKFDFSRLVLYMAICRVFDLPRQTGRQNGKKCIPM